MGKVVSGSSTGAAPPSSRTRPELDSLLDRLAERKEAWVRVEIPARIAYLKRCLEGIQAVAEDWVREACRHRGFDPASPLAGEEWLSGPMVTAQTLRLYAHSLAQDARPHPPRLRVTDDGQTIAKVFPTNLVDRLLYYNMSAEVWIEPGRPATQGRIYREKKTGSLSPGQIALVLGAGNISSIPPLDVLYKLFVEDQVVMLKMNPVNDYLGPFLERAFASLVSDGFLALAYGGPEVGEYLCHHPRVETIHLTGSDRTHDAIVWGGDASRHAERMAQGRPVVDKPVTAELGCVTPVLLVPGRWSAAALDFQARHVAAMVAHNASFNCNAAKVLVMARGWDQREAFLERLKVAMRRIPSRRAYYPGAHERYGAFLDRYPQAMALSEEGEETIPWTLIPDVAPIEGEYALNNEAFCGVLAEVSLEASDFLEQAVEFVNEKVWGTLSCALVVDRATARTRRAEVERAIARLRYGTVGVNVWPGVSYALGVTTWGAFPGHTAEDIGSGRGVVHNAFFFDHPQKSVLRAPFRIWPKPIWFADHRSLNRLGRHLTKLQLRRSPTRLAAVAWTGLRA
jgi:acyl-CoA reductase-like NAD-dependent aldehyde dehydrogenase